VDLQRLGRGEKIAGASAVLLFIFMFFDWFSVSVHGGGGLVGGSVGAGSAWDALDNIPIFLVITILLALAVVALRLTDAQYEPPISANAVVAVFGVISVLLILYRIVDTPGGGSFGGVSVDVSPDFGIFISLLAAAGLTYGSYVGMTDEGTTIADLTDRFSGGGGTGGTPTQTYTPPPASTTAPPPPPAEPTPPPAPSDPPPPPPPTQ
jgi:uncharacterized membrane protein YhaH (DUF805 family)